MTVPENRERIALQRQLIDISFIVDRRGETPSLVRRRTHVLARLDGLRARERARETEGCVYARFPSSDPTMGGE